MMERTPFLDPALATPLYVQLYEYFKREIEEKTISANSKLPSIRQLALHLKVSKNTVETAYQQLLAEGYIESKPKSGFIVPEIDSSFQIPFLNKKPKCPRPHLNQECMIDFQYGDIESSKFPMREWKRCLVEAVDMTNEEFFKYGDRQGHLGLREEIALYLLQARGVECDADEIVLCAGTQQSILLIIQLLELINQTVAIENPGYNGVREVFQKQHCQIVPIPLEADGVKLDEVFKSQAKALYLTPSHQFPLGMVLSITKRIKLLEWANKENSYLIEDDYDSEFRYQGQPIPSLKSLDHQDRVIYVGTFSKAFLPGTRVSYIVLPKALNRRYKEQFTYLNQSVSSIIQEALYQFMKNGHLSKHIRKMRKSYQIKHKKLLDCIHTYFGDRVTVIGQKAGLHLLLQLHNRNASELISQAHHVGVKIYPTELFWIHPKQQSKEYVMLGFGGLSEIDIEEGIKKLNSAWFG